MKGIAHFMSGVAMASFCPWSIEAAQNGDPTYFILGAVAGILPDTIDFKFYRFFYRYDLRIEPMVDQLDPQPIADAVALAVTRAKGGQRTTLKLGTIQVGVDNWRQYCVKIDSKAGEVNVQFGPVVSTGQVPQPDSLPHSRPVACAKFNAPVLSSDESVYTVDIFDGPSFAFERNKQGQIEIGFLPWHRNGSHSIVIGAMLCGIASLWTWQAGVVVFGAYVIHIIEDQMGYMGSNLFFPFTRNRVSGFRWMHSGDALPNFSVVWLCCLLIFWNVYIAIENPLYQFSFLQFIVAAMVLPFTCVGFLRRILVRLDKGSPDGISTEWNI